MVPDVAIEVLGRIRCRRPILSSKRRCSDRPARGSSTSGRTSVTARRPPPDAYELDGGRSSQWCVGALTVSECVPTIGKSGLTLFTAVEFEGDDAGVPIP